jgi:chemotaxis protein CheX
MDLTEDDIYSLVSEIWSSFLMLDVEPTAPVASSDRSISALIHIHGSWEGSVIVHCSHALSAHIASVMFDMPPEELTSDEIGDAIGEIVNMLGGSVKSLVDGPGSLSLPTVIGGSQYTLQIPGATELNEVWFVTAEQPLMVQVLERTSAAVPAV